MSIYVADIDVIKELDPYHRDTGGLTTTALHIDPDRRRVWVEQKEHSNSTPESYYHGRMLSYEIEDAEGPPGGDELKEFLSSAAGQALLHRICDGHEIRWNGHNNIGVLSADAIEAVDELLSAISTLPRSKWQSWTCEDWLGNVSDQDLGLWVGMSPEAVAVVARGIEDGAEDERVYLVDDIEEYLKKRLKWLEDK